jgi:hypothetical protein
MKNIDRLYIETYGNFAPRIHKDNYKLMGNTYVYCSHCDCYNLGIGQVLRRHYKRDKHRLNVFLTEYLRSFESRQVFHVVSDWGDEKPTRVMIIEPFQK